MWLLPLLPWHFVVSISPWHSCFAWGSFNRSNQACFLRSRDGCCLIVLEVLFSSLFSPGKLICGLIVGIMGLLVRSDFSSFHPRVRHQSSVHLLEAAIWHRGSWKVVGKGLFLSLKADLSLAFARANLKNLWSLDVVIGQSSLLSLRTNHLFPSFHFFFCWVLLGSFYCWFV